MPDLSSKIEELIHRTEKNNYWRQHQCFNLIPSETTPSLLVKMCEISDPAGRYAEHRTMKGKEVYFYQGTDFIREVEIEAKKELADFFNCSQIELRPISGQMANEVVFKAMVKFINRGRPPDQPLRKMKAVMNNELTKGGHLSSQPMGALFNYVEEDPKTGRERVINFPVSSANLYQIDTDQLASLLNQTKPELIIFGKSMFLYQEPVKFVYQIVKDWNSRPVIMYDMAHVLGLYGVFQEPLQEGVDIVTGSTHKTFFGPQRGIIISNINPESPLHKLWLDIQSRAFPGSTSNHHLGTLLALLLAAYEMNAFKEQYQTQVRKNAKAFAKSLKNSGIEVEGSESDGFTETHQVVIRVKRYGFGEEIARRLEENNIITNYQALPDDESFIESSGIRMGVQEITRFGMKEEDFDVLAGYIAEVIIQNKKIKEKIAKFRQNFLKMKYCLPLEKTIPLAVRILASLLPSSDYVKIFADNLAELVHSR
ncbi:MAG: serine hydroxymethyltransferase [Candidatus Aminicenantia bacterium]